MLNDEMMKSITWEEEMIQKEKECRESQRIQLLEFHAQNKRDDIMPWLLFTKWPELFKGKDIKTITETRFLNTNAKEILDMYQVSKSQLQTVS